jgi:hypothetical protein
MPKAILEFDLPEEEAEFQYACNGMHWYLIVDHVLQYIRQKIKYDDNLSNETIDILEDLRENIWSEISGRGLKVD